MWLHLSNFLREKLVCQVLSKSPQLPPPTLGVVAQRSFSSSSSFSSFLFFFQVEGGVRAQRKLFSETKLGRRRWVWRAPVLLQWSSETALRGRPAICVCFNSLCQTPASKFGWQNGIKRIPKICKPNSFILWQWKKNASWQHCSKKTFPPSGEERDPLFSGLCSKDPLSTWWNTNKFESPSPPPPPPLLFLLFLHLFFLFGQGLKWRGEQITRLVAPPPRSSVCEST